MIQTSTVWTIEGPDGTLLTLNGAEPIYLEEATGFADSPNVRTNIEELPEADGAIAGDSYWGARPVTLRGLIIGANSTERNQHVMNVKRAFRALRGDVTLKSQADGLPAMQATARLESLRIGGPYAKHFLVGLICPDPFYYSQELHARTGPTNKAADPSFESGALSPNWTPGGTAPSVVTTDPQHGADHLEATSSGTGTDHSLVQSLGFIDVDTSKPYVLSAYLKKSAGAVSSKTHLRVQCYDVNGVSLGQVYGAAIAGLTQIGSSGVDLTGAYARYGGLFQGTGGAAGNSSGLFITGTVKIKIALYLHFQTAAAVTVRADAIQFEQNEEPTDFTVGAYVAGAHFPWVFPISFGGGSGAAAEVQAANEGTADAAATCRAWGPITNPIFENATTEESLYVDGLVLTAGDYLDVDFAAHTVERADGSSAYDLVRFPGSVWWKLQPGSNQIQLRGSNTGAGVALDVSWRDSWD